MQNIQLSETRLKGGSVSLHIDSEFKVESYDNAVSDCLLH